MNIICLKHLIVRSLILCCLLLNATLFPTLSRADDLYSDAYLENLKNGSLLLQIKTCKKIHDFSGLRDTRLFDQLESNIKTLAAKEKPNREEQEALTWSMRALASSGREQYSDIFKHIAETTKKRKVRKGAEIAQEDLDKFKRWNPVIDSAEFEQAGRGKNTALWMRMVASKEWDIAMYAVEQAQTFQEYNLDFIILLEEQLHQANQETDINKEKMAFLELTLNYLMAHPEFGKFTSLVNDVAENSKDKKLTSAARKALNR